MMRCIKVQMHTLLATYTWHGIANEYQKDMYSFSNTNAVYTLTMLPLQCKTVLKDPANFCIIALA